MSEITTGLRNRFHNTVKDTTEELLIEKLDIFLSSIESRLDQFEKYFKFNNLQELEHSDDLKGERVDHGSIEGIDEGTGEETGESGIQGTVLEETEDGVDGLMVPRGRRGSTSSVQSFKSFAKLDMIHQRLQFIKQSVLKSSITNLDYLYNTLDDQYNYLFSGDTFTSPESTFDTSKEILSQKIITTLQYFDEKLIHIDDMIQKRMKTVETDESIFNIFKFYNFNKALKVAEDGHLHYYQLPLGWRENRYIINGYRFSLKHTETIKSMFRFNHNESMNIWTHLVGFGIMCYLWFIHFPSTEVYAKNSFNDNVMVYFYLICAMSCLISSATWHTYSCFARITTRYRFACVDYTGITILITASVVGVEYVALLNYPKLLKFFVSFSVLAGTSGLGFNWSPYFDKPECRSIRIGYFVGLGALGVGTGFTVCFYEGIVKTGSFFAPLFYKSFVWYWIGVVFYGGLIPERWRYDVIINEDAYCKHQHDSSDIIEGNYEKSGEEEMEEIEDELTNEILKSDSSINSTTDVTENAKFKEIIDKHFPEQPIRTNYHKDFFSLWWVDYMFSSHNLWHIFVVLGILGHYSCVLEMCDKVNS